MLLEKVFKCSAGAIHPGWNVEGAGKVSSRWASQTAQNWSSQAPAYHAEMLPIWYYDRGPQRFLKLHHSLNGPCTFCTILQSGTLFLTLDICLNPLSLQGPAQILLLPWHHLATLGPQCCPHQRSPCFSPVPYSPPSLQSDSFKISVIIWHFPVQNPPVASSFHLK